MIYWCPRAHFSRNLYPPFLITSLLILKFLLKLDEHTKAGKFKIQMELGLTKEKSLRLTHCRTMSPCDRNGTKAIWSHMGNILWSHYEYTDNYCLTPLLSLLFISYQRFLGSQTCFGFCFFIICGGGVVVLFYFVLCETCLAQSGLEAMILLSHPCKCWNYRNVPSHLAHRNIFAQLFYASIVISCLFRKICWH